MKNVFIGLCVAILLGVVVAGLLNFQDLGHKQQNNDYLRIHIRANSNDKIDQDVKYEVKDAIVNYLSPMVAELTSVSASKCVVKEHLVEIQNVANEVLSNNGFDYSANVKLTTEQFPDRSYNELFLAEGIYDALIIELGGGQGNNWWCVIFPPLCFVNGEENGTGKVEYKSKIAELINNF